MSFRENIVRVEVQNEPVFACLRCWKLKKKCDRSYPKCNRCDLMNVSCVYSSQAPTDRAGSLRSRVSEAVPLYTPPERANDAEKRCTPPPTPLSNALLSTTSQVSTGQRLLPVVEIRRAFDDFLSAQLHDAYNALRHELKATCNSYLDTINTSLPLVIDTELRTHLSNLDQITDTEIRLLLLSIYLVTKMPVQLPDGGTDIGSLYSIIKPFYADFNSTRIPSIPIIQAGLFIAIYEQGQALDEAAYLTIGVCARMGQAIGLHKCLQEDLPSDPCVRDLLETRKHVWWILICLDRILALESKEPNRPLATKHPALDDHLPSFWGRDVENFLTIGKVADSYSEFPEIVFTPANSFARSCQATYLLSLVFSHIGDGRKDSSGRHAEARYLDETLQAFSLFIIEQSNREIDVPWNYSCAAYMICMIALCSLHHYNLFINTDSSQMAQAEQDFTRTSRLALKSFARIATDGASTKLYDRVDGARNAAPYTLHFFREMAVIVLQMGCEEGKKTQHLLAEISSLRNYLSVASEKWKLAGRHLQEIEMVASSLCDRA